MSFFKKLRNLFVAPTKLFENINTTPKYGLPLLFVLVLTTITAIFSYPSSIIQQNEIINQVTQIYGTSMQPLQDTTMNLNNIFLLCLLTPIGALLGLLLNTLFLLLFSKILKGKANFKQTFCLLIHVSMLTSIFALITSVFKFFLHNYVDLFSFAVFLPNIQFSSIIHDILFSVTLYGIWQTILIGMGLSIINKYSKTKGYIVSIIIYSLGILLQIFSIQMQFFAQNMLTTMP